MTHLGELLSAYLDGELNLPEERQARAHLQECSACRRELGEVQEARARLRALPVADLPASLVPAGQQRRPPARSRRLAALVAAAAAMAVVGIGLLAGQPAPVEVDLDTIGDQHAARAVLDPGPVSVRLAAAVHE
ncbi:MAG: zf-HC2 domain-containing protein [Actinomycetota bacterium]|nr:zf-HC2 domain-containing protein [Actinomycetota bacterium]